MLKLGIFGDSYGCSAMRDNDIPDKAWVSYIAESGLYDVENFCLGGSDLYFSYKNFVTNQSKFDKIIFLVTNPNRVYLTELNTFTNASQAHAKLRLASKPDKEQFETVINYYKYIHDEERELVFHEMLVDKIKEIRPDTIFYPCFDLPFMDDFSLSNITSFEDSAIGLNSSVRHSFYLKGLRDSRKCHMTGENNKLVADMFLKRLNGQNAVLSNKDLIAPMHGVDYYYQSKFFIVDGKY